MLKTLKKFLNSVLDVVLPLRSDFEIVKNLDEETMFSLPRAKKIENLDWIHSLWEYRNRKVKAVIWELKYRENVSPLTTIGKMLFDEIIAIVSDIVIFNSDAEFLLIPIPMTEESRVERGYNQSELIAKSILENDEKRTLVYAPQFFLKTKETNKQSHSQSKLERLQNLEGCFEADPRVEGKYIFLIDDVVTTGSTLTEARKTLLDAGAKDVFALTIAH